MVSISTAATTEAWYSLDSGALLTVVVVVVVVVVEVVVVGV